MKNSKVISIMLLLSLFFVFLMSATRWLLSSVWNISAVKFSLLFIAVIVDILLLAYLLMDSDWNSSTWFVLGVFVIFSLFLLHSIVFDLRVLYGLLVFLLLFIAAMVSVNELAGNASKRIRDETSVIEELKLKDEVQDYRAKKTEEKLRGIEEREKQIEEREAELEEKEAEISEILARVNAKLESAQPRTAAKKHEPAKTKTERRAASKAVSALSKYY